MVTLRFDRNGFLIGEALLFLNIILCLILALQAIVTRNEREQDVYQQMLDNDVMNDIYAQE